MSHHLYYLVVQPDSKCVIDEGGGKDAQEGDHEPLPDPGDHADDLLEGDLPASVDAGDGVDHGRRGEEGEDKDVSRLEEEEKGPLLGQDIGQLLVPQGPDATVEGHPL